MTGWTVRGKGVRRGVGEKRQKKNHRRRRNGEVDDQPIDQQGKDRAICLWEYGRDLQFKTIIIHVWIWINLVPVQQPSLFNNKGEKLALQLHTVWTCNQPGLGPSPITLGLGVRLYFCSRGGVYNEPWCWFVFLSSLPVYFCLPDLFLYFSASARGYRNSCAKDIRNIQAQNRLWILQPCQPYKTVLCL